MGSIIHVDNSEFFRKVTKAFLTKLGYESDGFARGEDALDVVTAGMANCVITGLELADMNGEDFIKQLAVSAHLVPIIVITSRDDGEANLRLENMGVKAIIQKSGNWEKELHELLEHLKEEGEIALTMSNEQ